MAAKISKIGYKLWRRISAVFLLLFIVLYVLINVITQFMYYQEQKHLLEEAVSALELSKPATTQLDAYLNAYEASSGVTGVSADLSLEEILFNDSIRWQFGVKKLAFTKLWFVEERIEGLRQGKQYIMDFDQGKAQNTYLACLYPYEEKAVVFVVSMSAGAGWLSVLNRYLPWVFMSVYGVALFIIWRISKDISRPIALLKAQSEAIAQQDYGLIELKTGDELEELANSQNAMSTELAHFHLQMAEKNRVLKDMIQGMSHEMKTPLALINAYAAGIRDGISSEQAPEIIMTQVERLSHMMDQMLSLAKFEQLVFEKEPVDLAVLCREEMMSFEAALRVQAMTISAELPESAIVQGNKDMLRSVIQNLISNALKYGDEPEIHMSLTENLTQSRWVLCIENSASPMTEEVLARLTEPFYVAESSRSNLLSGTGLGLSLVASVLKRHGFDSDIIYKEGLFIVSVYF